MLASQVDSQIVGLLLIAFLAVVHASFQVASSVLTLLSGHSFIRSKAHNRLTRLNLAYILGVFVMTALLLASATTVFTLWLPYELYELTWYVLISASVLIATLILAFYYRQGKGTRLWLPRAFASYLDSRAKKTKNAIEAVALGVISVIAELPFTAVILLTVGFVIASTVMIDQYVAMLALYSLVSVLPLGIITVLLAGGHKLSEIQRWRESNKQFLQFASGISLLVAALFIWANYMLLGSSV